MFMPDVVDAMLAAHLQREGLGKDDPDELVLTDDEGRALRDSNWRRGIWEPATEAAGCARRGLPRPPPPECHDARPSKAST